MVKFNEVKHISTEEYFNNNEYAVDMFESKYAHDLNDRKETPAEVFYRIASELAQFEDEDKKQYYIDIWFDLMYEGWFRPGGSIISSLGSGRKSSLLNCTTLPIEDDTIESISKAEYVLMKCAAYRQGTGIDLSNLRPRGSKLGNAAEESTGIIPWAKKYSDVGNYVGQCLDGDTWISTSQGKIKISEMVNSDKDFFIKTHNNYEKVINKFDNGKQDLYKMKSRDGAEIIATKEHRFVIYDSIDEKYKIVKMKDLRETDMIVKLVQKN